MQFLKGRKEERFFTHFQGLWCHFVFTTLSMKAAPPKIMVIVFVKDDDNNYTYIRSLQSTFQSTHHSGTL